MAAGSSLDAVADSEDGEAQEDRFGQAGGHLDVGAGGGQVLAGGAEHHRVERDVQGLLEALAGEPVAGGVLRIVLVDLEGDLASASGDGAFRAVPGSATDPGTRFLLYSMNWKVHA